MFDPQAKIINSTRILISMALDQKMEPYPFLKLSESYRLKTHE